MQMEQRSPGMMSGHLTWIHRYICPRAAIAYRRQLATATAVVTVHQRLPAVAPSAIGPLFATALILDGGIRR
jgi:hypothetical protein